MQPLIISVLGKDKPGLVDALAKKVYQHGGNWQGSSFAHMAGMFTGFVEVHAPADSHQALIAALDQMPDLTVQSVSAADSASSHTTRLQVEIMGNDKSGIVQELTSVLNEFNLNIVNFDSHCESAPNWGSLMFKATAVIAVPESFDQDRLQQALENLANDLVVDIHTTY
ncbi:glycine cleavage system protein R [Alteromonas halophila]|uniref:Glycine cleavage system transcriptional repressor n=1 Tax=Alteromonas halophila TaxID=516698 RepID=A0A918MY92_9ALTE|nr:ACT domain-containing protein [Alteromonas halophila]GGW81257.1 glycine cleavage system protein R [Alteromonas halophila]